MRSARHQMFQLRQQDHAFLSVRVTGHGGRLWQGFGVSVPWDGRGLQLSSASSAGCGGGAKVRTGTEKRSSSRSSGVGAKARVPGMAAVFLSGGCADHAGTVQRFDDGARGRAGEKVE